MSIGVHNIGQGKSVGLWWTALLMYSNMCWTLVQIESHCLHINMCTGDEIRGGRVQDWFSLNWMEYSGVSIDQMTNPYGQLTLLIRDYIPSLYRLCLVSRLWRTLHSHIPQWLWKASRAMSISSDQLAADPVVLSYRVFFSSKTVSLTCTFGFAGLSSQCPGWN